METMDIPIRLLCAADDALYREIRLEALRLSPEAFGSTFEAENAQPLSWFSERLQSGAKIFGAFHGSEIGSEIVGLAGLRLNRSTKEAHKGLLVSMYVRPEARNSGVGQRLVETILEYARGRAELVQLSVVRENQPALRLYSRLGFVEYGVERNALKQDGRYFDEVLMAIDLKPVEQAQTGKTRGEAKSG
jgi:ribosomal protein S18 acetylase RimI-like enzyme